MYILNHTNTTLSVGQFADIGPGKYIKADSHILASAETAYAVRASWATLHETPPKEIIFAGEVVNFEKAAIEGTTEFPTDEPQAKPGEVEVVEAVQEEPAAEPETPVKKAGRKPAAEQEAK